MAVPDFLLPALGALRDYMLGFYPDQTIPLAFWLIEDDELLFETLGYFPLITGETVAAHWDEVPEGFRLAYPVFALEDDYQINGWDALSNADEELLTRAMQAYDRIGMPTEAQALRAVLAARRDGSDDAALEAVYKSVPNPFIDEDRKNHALLAFFCSHRHLFDA